MEYRINLSTKCTKNTKKNILHLSCSFVIFVENFFYFLLKSAGLSPHFSVFHFRTSLA
jgi:hypothetical protein